MEEITCIDIKCNRIFSNEKDFFDPQKHSSICYVRRLANNPF